MSPPTALCSLVGVCRTDCTNGQSWVPWDPPHQEAHLFLLCQVHKMLEKVTTEMQDRLHAYTAHACRLHMHSVHMSAYALALH